jgi:hypothetical protein
MSARRPSYTEQLERLAADLKAQLEAQQARARVHEQMIADLMAERERLTAPPIEWRELGGCPRGPFTYEWLRNWAATGVINSKKDHGRVLVDMASLREYLARKGITLPAA